MRTIAYAEGLRQVVDSGPAWTVEAVRQVRYHVVTSNDLFAPENPTLLAGCEDAPLRRRG
ncbi:hypothetical protein GCM10027570_14070 [Streptomonospora sediminis]